MNIPNLITIFRFFLIPLFVNMLIYKKFGWALIVFFIAGLSDMLDGMLARLLKQRTKLGSLLDPTADKLLINTAFVALALMKIVPGWLAIIVVSRDFIIFLQWILFLNFSANKELEIRPLLESKFNTFFQLATILVALYLNLQPQTHALADYLFVFCQYVTAALTVISGLHYIYIGLQIFE
jgi:cardiolipin synthase